MKHIYLSAFVLLCLVPYQASSDYGITAIDITCDTKTNSIEVRPYIMWNEDLAKFDEENPTGERYSNGTYTKLFHKSDDRMRFRHICKLPKAQYEISVNWKWLIIKTDGKTILNKHLDYIWFASGELYSVRAGGNGVWSECCGGDEGTIGPPHSCAALTESKTSNCDDVLKHRKMSPNKPLEPTR